MSSNNVEIAEDKKERKFLKLQKIIITLLL